MVGPFLADGKSNDASIATNLLYQNKQAILEWLNGDTDVILTDRGFRDAIKTIEMLGFRPAILRFLNGQKQLLVADANYSDV